MKPGDVVKFREVLEDGDEDARFAVLEMRGDRVLVQSLDPAFANWRLKPTTVYSVKELEICAF